MLLKLGSYSKSLSFTTLACVMSIITINNIHEILFVCEDEKRDLNILKALVLSLLIQKNVYDPNSLYRYLTASIIH